MADNIAAKDGNDADVTLATKEIAGAHYDKVMPADPTTGAPFKAADDATVAAANVILEAVQAAIESLNGKTPAAGPLTNTQLRASPVQQRVQEFNYPISTANSSTTQLAAGASFIGGIETAQDQPSLSILLTSDQPMTVTVRQFIDVAGTFAAPDIVFYVAAGAGFARSLTINGNFCRVIAQNTGSATTTTFNLNCAFGALGDSDSSGVQPVTELPLVLTGAAAQTAVVNNILTPASGANGLRVDNYRSASVQVVSTGTGGTFIFEQSNDGTSWVALPVFNAALVTAAPTTAAITATASSIIYTFPVRAVFLRLRIATTITGGSIRAHTRLSTEPWTAAAQLVASNTAANMLAQVSGTVTANWGTLTTPTANILNSAATTNGTVVKGSAGTLHSITASNTNAAVRYLKLHNSTTVTVGTTAVALTIQIPAGGTVTVRFGTLGMRFGTGICISTTTGAADNDIGAVAAGEIKVLTSFI